MDLDEIQSIQSRERQTDSLQQLRDSFYEEAGEFVRTLRAERERAAEAAGDPFDSPKVTRLSDDIDTAEQTLQAIYERRVGKVVKMASLAAANMPTEEDGLTTEERDLFEDLVRSIVSNRERVFDVLDGESMAVAGDAATTSPVEGIQPQATDGAETDPARDTDSLAIDPDQPVPAENSDTDEPAEDEGVPAADLMGTTTAAEGKSDQAKEPGTSQADDSARRTRRDGGPPDSTAGRGHDTHGTDSVERTTVRITSDVGEILGVDDRTYELVAEDVVTLPATNANPLLERGVAETLQ